jgi:uncharacterized protein (DUF58 family)
MTNAAPPPGVAVTLAELVRLRVRPHEFSLLPRQPARSLLAGRHASRLRGRGLNFEEIRRYQPGDDVRQIDWKATVRTRKTQSRVYTEERERTVLLVVDQRRTMFFGSVQNMKSVTAAQAAALVAWRVIAQQDRLGGLVFNDERIDEVRPERRESAVMRLMKFLVDQNRALLESPSGDAQPGMFNEALRRCAKLAPHDCIAVIISDASGHDEASRRLLSEIARHNDVLWIYVFDPLEAALPDAGSLIFSDGQRQLEVNTSDDSLLKGFRQSFAAERAAGRRFLLQREIPILRLSTAESVVRQIAGQLGNPRQ